MVDVDISQRSMKAGAFTPATLEQVGPHGPDYLMRSMKAGAFTPATPEPSAETAGPEVRSMKAGAFTPATPGR